MMFKDCNVPLKVKILKDHQIPSKLKDGNLSLHIMRIGPCLLEYHSQDAPKTFEEYRL